MVAQQNALLQMEVTEQARVAESRFLSNMSHEIRNPLNGIRGLLEAIESDDGATPRIREDAQIALTTANHLNALVNDILQMKRIEEGHFSLSRETFDLHALLKSSSAYHTVLAQKKGILFVADYAIDDLPRFVIDDPVRLYQVAVNILGNAIKFTDTGSVTEQLTFEDGWLKATYADTGIGMSEKTLSMLFGRFSHGDQGVAKKFGGSGLGLHLTKQIVDLAGGALQVESELGAGSRFIVSIPPPIDNTRHDAPRHERPRVAPTAELDASIGLSGLQVLCVDDSNINLKVISRPLIKAGASVTTACSGTEALELIRVHEFDIVLTDISMPGMDGEQLQQELKAWKLGLPVVAVTGNVLPEDVGRHIANGFVAALGKPLDIDQLMEVVRDKVGQAKASLN